MSIRDWVEKIKWQGRELLQSVRGGENTARYYTVVIIILVGLSSFGLGRLSILDERHKPIRIEQDTTLTTKAETHTVTSAIKSQTQSASVTVSVKTTQPPTVSASGNIVASKNGTKYYFPWCSSNIADKNKIWFNSEADARAKGYLPAANCKGLK
jgi:hypothetical protein